ncbi:MAG: succinate dehydrogenase cytochrome b subunit [Chitinophagales bacterium]|nr:succinate dehydrogenase cytochrome b subunit [Chitinophagales bacterium]
MSNGNFFTSSVGRKSIMGATGFFLISFLVVHVAINSLIFINIFNPSDKGHTFNVAANFMATNWVIHIMEVVLVLGLLAHAATGIRITILNKQKRPVKYAIAPTSSTWYSRSMGLLGTLILLFLVVHLRDFWYPTKVAEFVNHDIDQFNTYQVIVAAFQNPIRVVIYLVGVASLFYHLMHGFQAAFRTFGLVNKKYFSTIQCAGKYFAIIVCTLFALMPILTFIGLIK